MSGYWPSGMAVDPIGIWPGELTAKRALSPFTAQFRDTLTLLSREMYQLSAKNIRLQVAIPASQFRLDGYPRATAKQEHPGIILTLDSQHGPLSYPCDRFVSWQDNLRAVALALEALRKVDRYGVTRRGEQYRGFLAIEAAPGDDYSTLDGVMTLLTRVTGKSWPDPRIRLPEIFRHAKFRTHPDTAPAGTDPDDYARVVGAEQYLKQNGKI